MVVSMDCFSVSSARTLQLLSGGVHFWTASGIIVVSYSVKVLY